MNPPEKFNLSLVHSTLYVWPFKELLAKADRMSGSGEEKLKVCLDGRFGAKGSATHTLL